MNKFRNDNTNDQFPGVYFSLITKHNIKNEVLYSGKNVLIFSYKLLDQKNYHINIHDNNGSITETNTYYPWNIKDAVNKIKSITTNNNNNNNKQKVNTINEVVFHDPISMKYCCREIELPTGGEISHFSNNESKRYYNNNFLPPERICSREPDMSKKPFYCYPQDEINYKEDNTELDETLSSSNQFLKTIASVCNIKTGTDTLNKNQIIDKIKKNMYYLYENREGQNIKALKDFTQKDKKNELVGGKKRKTKRIINMRKKQTKRKK